MGRNVEVKIELSDQEFEKVKRIAGELTQSKPVILEQLDTFFHSRTGRLKFRSFGDGSGELIFYERPDRPGPKVSSYMRSLIPEPDTVISSLAGALGIRGVIKKRRELFLHGQTRIHLDAVEGLGKFLELEVVLESEQPREFGETEAEEILNTLEVAGHGQIPVAYIDLMERRRK